MLDAKADSIAISARVLYERIAAIKPVAESKPELRGAYNELAKLYGATLELARLLGV